MFAVGAGVSRVAAAVKVTGRTHARLTVLTRRWLARILDCTARKYAPITHARGIFLQGTADLRTIAPPQHFSVTCGYWITCSGEAGGISVDIIIIIVRIAVILVGLILAHSVSQRVEY